jgi:hypothetical protein
MPHEICRASVYGALMTDVIELEPGEYPNRITKHALMISSCAPPGVGCPVTDHWYGRRFYANPDEQAIALMIKRAKVWADARGIGQVYVRRDGLIASARD